MRASIESCVEGAAEFEADADILTAKLYDRVLAVATRLDATITIAEELALIADAAHPRRVAELRAELAALEG